MSGKVKKNFWFYFFLLPFTFCLLTSGCIRLTGNAGVWKQGADDEEPSSAEVGFDTNQIIPSKDTRP